MAISPMCGGIDRQGLRLCNDMLFGHSLPEIPSRRQTDHHFVLECDGGWPIFRKPDTQSPAHNVGSIQLLPDPFLVV
jgi:hypothetical protein